MATNENQGNALFTSAGVTLANGYVQTGALAVEIPCSGHPFTFQLGKSGDDFSSKTFYIECAQFSADEMGMTYPAWLADTATSGLWQAITFQTNPTGSWTAVMTSLLTVTNPFSHVRMRRTSGGTPSVLLSWTINGN